ncbi:unnamed protein product [Musa banksii]
MCKPKLESCYLSHHLGHICLQRVGLSVICDKDPMPKSGPHSYAFFWRPPGYRTLNKDPIWSFWHAKYKQFHHGGRAAFHGSWNGRAVLVCHPFHNKLEYCI